MFFRVFTSSGAAGGPVFHNTKYTSNHQTDVRTSFQYASPPIRSKKLQKQCDAKAGRRGSFSSNATAVVECLSSLLIFLRACGW